VDYYDHHWFPGKLVEARQKGRRLQAHRISRYFSPTAAPRRFSMASKFLSPEQQFRLVFPDEFVPPVFFYAEEEEEEEEEKDTKEENQAK
jgi:hypothetical protein